MSITVDVQVLPEVQEMLAQFTGGKLNNRVRRAARAGIKPIREEMRRKGGTGGFPRRFKKTRTRGHRNPVGVSVSPQSPLSTIFEHGAKNHSIAPKRGAFLASGQGEAPFFARGAVSHPGMAARPFIAPVFAASKEKATKAFMDTLMEGL